MGESPTVGKALATTLRGTRKKGVFFFFFFFFFLLCFVLFCFLDTERDSHDYSQNLSVSKKNSIGGISGVIFQTLLYSKKRVPKNKG